MIWYWRITASIAGWKMKTVRKITLKSNRTPQHWGEQITGVPRQYIETIAREFADTAHKTHGRSMIILGAGVNHWYHMDMNYRGMINMLIFCGVCRAKRWRLGTLCRPGKTAPTNRLVATGLCARLEPTTAPNEQHLVFLQSFQPMAL